MNYNKEKSEVVAARVAQILEDKGYHVDYVPDGYISCVLIDGEARCYFHVWLARNLMYHAELRRTYVGEHGKYYHYVGKVVRGFKCPQRAAEKIAESVLARLDKYKEETKVELEYEPRMASIKAAAEKASALGYGWYAREEDVRMYASETIYIHQSLLNEESRQAAVALKARIASMVAEFNESHRLAE